MQIMSLQRQATASVLIVYPDTPMPEKVQTDGRVPSFANAPEVNVETPLQSDFVAKCPLEVLTGNRNRSAIWKNPHFRSRS